MMKRYHYQTTIFIFFAVLTSACGVATKNGHTYIDGHCVTCLNNPITGEPYNYDKAQHPRNSQYSAAGSGGYDETQNAEPVYYKDSIRFTVRLPIDTAYVRIKREFGFVTRTEALGRVSHKQEWLDYDDSFRYEALPGVSYHLRKAIDHRFRGVYREKDTVDALLEKNGSGTDITLTYWVDIPKSQVPAYGRSLKKRALRVLR